MKPLTADERASLRGVIEAAPVGAIINLPASAVLALLDELELRIPEPPRRPFRPAAADE